MHPATWRTVRVVAQLAVASCALTTGAAQQVLNPSALGDQSGASLKPGYRPPGGFSPADVPGAALLARGIATFRPHAHYTMVYADGLKSANANTAATYIDTYALGFLWRMGEYWNFDYTRSWVQYSQRDFRDTVSDHLSVDGRVHHGNWAGTFAQRYSRTDTPLVETGRQTRRERSDTNGSSTWRLNRHLTASLAADQRLTFVETLPDIYEWSVRPSLMTELTKGIHVGASVTAGYMLMYRSSDTISVRPAANVAWQITNKTTVSFQVGSDSLRFVSPDRGRIRTTSYSAQLEYAPFTVTGISIEAESGTEAAPFRNHATKSDRRAIRLRQRLLGRLNLLLSAGEQESRYVAAFAALATTRADRVRTYDASLGTTFLKRGTANAFYRVSKNRSSLANFAFSSRQIGFELGFRY